MSGLAAAAGGRVARPRTSSTLFPCSARQLWWRIRRKPWKGGLSRYVCHPPSTVRSPHHTATSGHRTTPPLPSAVTTYRLPSPHHTATAVRSPHHTATARPVTAPHRRFRPTRVALAAACCRRRNGPLRVAAISVLSSCTQASPHPIRPTLHDQTPARVRHRSGLLLTARRACAALPRRVNVYLARP